MKHVDVDDLIRRYLAGESVHQLAKQLGVSQGAVRLRLRRADVPMRSQAQGIRLVQERRVTVDPAALAARYEGGTPATQLAREHGMGVFLVRRLLAARTAIRSPREAAVLQHTKRVDDLQQVIARYRAGASMKDLAGAAGIKESTLRRKMAAAGVPIRGRDETHRNAALDAAAPALVLDYRAGESVNELARRYGVTRGAVALRLVAAGVELRGRAGAALQKRASLRRAATRQAKLLNRQPAEDALAGALAGLGVPVEPQLAAGNYNVDLGVEELAVAVEVESGPAFRYPMSVQLWERTKNLLDHKWAVLHVVTGYKPLVFPDVAYKVIAFLDLARRDESLRGQYGVIDRKGDVAAASRYNLHGLPRVKGF